ncbi:MAG: V-type ATP synthase subunit I [Lachnospiraceae bacterium]|jgi:V/A-type H+-transporting ATPase subunit I
MAIVEMQKLSICANKKKRKAILELLQTMGAMQITTEGLDAEGLEKMDTASQRAQFEKDAQSFEQVLKLLDTYAPEKKKGLSLLSEKTLIPNSEFKDAENNRQKYLTDAGSVLKAEKELQECKGTIAKDRDTITSLGPWMDLDVPMIFEGTRDTSFYIGTIPGSLSEDTVFAAVSKDLPEPTAVTADVISLSGGQTNVTVLCLKRDAEKVESNLREAGFAKLPFITRYTPQQKKQNCEADIEKQTARIEELRQQIVQYAPEREAFKVSSDYFRTRAEKYRVLGTIPQSKNMFFLEGWVEAAHADDIAKLLTDKFGALVEKEEKRRDEMIPTELHNNKWSSMVEGVLESYGLPQHGRVDPTFVMSIFYVFFFGMMLSDAGYGILMMVVCGIALAKYKRLDKHVHQMVQLFFWCGLSTTFWGVMYGGFFGDAIDVVATTFFGYTGSGIIKPLWFDPLSNPMKLLVYCMLFGLIHLFAGLGIKGYEYLKKKDYLSFTAEVLAWYMFLIGLILLLLPTDIFEGMSQMTFNFPPFVHTLALVLTFGGMILIILLQEHARKNWALRILVGLYDIYGVSSWLSDVLSYSRLLALGLATGVIASVVNMMASMAGGGVVGAIVFIVVFIFGHVLNFLINVLGAYVHTNRLQYVEFFGKFYDAGGSPFRPFKPANKYTEIKEVTKL